MASMTVLTNGSSLIPPKPKFLEFNQRYLKRANSLMLPHRVSCNVIFGTPVYRIFSLPTLRVRSFRDNNEASDIDEKPTVEESKTRTAKPGNSLIVKLGIALMIAVTVTIISCGFAGSGPRLSIGIQRLSEASSSTAAASSVGFSFNAFGYRFLLPEYAPGWVYFWLLMAAGCGLFISEEALNIWVGISLSRMLTLDGTWLSFVESLSRNAPYVTSTVFWVYCGVCVSDMIPFYLGKLFKNSGASDDVGARLGIGKDKALNITQAVQRYGNLIGVVERFSIGVRNPTAFLAGALGISPEYFFAGVCCGGLITLPIQLAIGFLLRERPVAALATVATAVGLFTILPYAVAASTALFLFLRRRYP